MALAEEPTAPGRPGADPPTTEDTRIQILREFILEFYRIAGNPSARLDGDTFARRFAVFADQRDLPPVSRQRLYADLRALGLIVQPGAANRTQIFGVEEAPHAPQILARLDDGWPALSAQFDEARIDRAVSRARDAVRDTLHLVPAVIEEAVDTTLQIMRTSQDEGRRLMAANMIMSRGIPQLKAREPELQAIDIEVKNRATLHEIEEILLRHPPSAPPPSPASQSVEM